MIKGVLNSLGFRLLLLVLMTVLLTWLCLNKEWVWVVIAGAFWLLSIHMLRMLYKRNAQKVAFMFDAIDNSDYAFKYALKVRSSDDKLVNKSLNRITDILLQAKSEAIQQEKYYELILNSVNTGIIVIDDRGYVFQINNEALRLLGLNVFTHVKQLRKVDENLESLIEHIQPGGKHQISFYNERGTIHLSIRASEMTLQDKHVRIIAVNDINTELDDKELDSWIRLTRVLTHEIMNSVTPMTSLSDTLVSMNKDMDDEVRSGLEVISTTGKTLLAFVESYRKFTRIPTPEPSLFYVNKFLERLIQLSKHQNDYPHISFVLDVQQDDLILYADENLITQVVLNLLKNAMQAIGHERMDGEIVIKAFSNNEEAVIIEVSNNGPLISPDMAEHIFVPFFTTKESGSGIGLSLSRQIMRVSGGSISLKSDSEAGITTFVLLFP
ncbi:PAS domain-containing protein [Parabacteroides sp. OttesenSCG-928-G07]|nr:PAS domain-containing protein [Parabacteroides sp. OttesenSCG-928-G21]MDL2278043.1 PAS domain-containing protein [Parabacteroides sp. OttesenSCG-928-G07]